MAKNPKGHVESIIATQVKPGQVLNPGGRPPNAGRTLREKVNDFVHQKLTAARLRAIAKSPKMPVADRAAANRLLQMMRMPDLADYEPVMDGSLSLKKLRAKGIDTSHIKKCKTTTRSYGKGDEATTETTREIELADQSREEFKLVTEQTDGLPEGTQNVNVSVFRTEADRNIEADSIADRLKSILKPSAS